MNGTAVRLLMIASLTMAPALHAQQEETTDTTSQARVDGHWCGRGLLRGTTLNLTRRLDQFEGTLVRGDRVRSVDGSIEGSTLRTSPASAGRAGELVLEVQGDHLRIVTAGGPLSLAQGMSFFRGADSGC
jgi:hypothetical protein